MDGAEIRRLRRQAGLTQEALAERVGVEQGTVSRWEREIESPRPRSANVLRSLLLTDLETNSIQRQLALLRGNLIAGGMLDVQTRLKEVSNRTVRFYRQRSNFDIHEDIGKPLEQQLLEKGGQVSLEVVERSGVFRGEALLLRLLLSGPGISYLTHYEPSYQDGEFAGVFVFLVRVSPIGTDLPPPMLRYADVLRRDDPGNVAVLHCGAGADAAKNILLNDIPE